MHIEISRCNTFDGIDKKSFHYYWWFVGIIVFIRLQKFYIFFTAIDLIEN